jgi:hypothetical protein
VSAAHTSEGTSARKPTKNPHAAKAKAKLLRDALRAASSDGASVQAIALLALIIAEAWPNENTRGVRRGVWIARMGYPLMARRLNASVPSVRRWVEQLLELNLVQQRSGVGREVSTWAIGRRSRVLTREHSDCSPVNARVLARDHSECSPVITVSDITPDVIQPDPRDTEAREDREAPVDPGGLVACPVAGEEAARAHSRVAPLRGAGRGSREEIGAEA